MLVRAMGNTRYLLIALLFVAGCQLRGEQGDIRSDAPALGGARFVEVLTGGATSEEDLPVVVALHGMGSTPEKFAGAYARLEARARVLVPQAPLPKGQGWSWFPYQVGESDPAGLASRLVDAESRVVAILRDAHGAHPGELPVVTGFSQGGMLSFVVAVRHPELVREALPVGGYLPEVFPITAPTGASVPVHAFHGEADRVVPVAGARLTVDRMKENGFQATLSSYPGIDHHISGDLATDYLAALSAAVRAKSSGLEP